MNILKQLLSDASAAGFGFIVKCEGETDYRGRDVEDALEALEACDEMELTLCSSEIHDGHSWALIVNDCEGLEKLADMSGLWLNRWYEENA